MTIIYQLNKNAFGTADSSVNKIIDGLTVACIPLNPDNTDYQAYLKWVAEGNTPLPAENT